MTKTTRAGARPSGSGAATATAATLLLLIAAAAAPSPAEAAPSWPGLGNWRRRRAVALADAIIAGSARDAKESSAAGRGGLSAAGRAAAAAAAAAAPPSRTQAGCACLAQWSFDALSYSQCANPNRDPNGYWCAVDQATCPGYYGAFPIPSSGGDDDGGGNGNGNGNGAGDSSSSNNKKAKLLAYDYCVGTDATGVFWPGPRERTTSGCLCQSGRWTLALPGEDSAAAGALGPGVPAGKPSYRDRCARPGGPGTARQCVVDVRTCPDPRALLSSPAVVSGASASSSPSDAAVVDSCSPMLDDDGDEADEAALAAAAAETETDPETARAAEEQRAAARYFRSTPPEAHRTVAAGCPCDPGGWRYTYPDGSEGPLLQGCHNPDGDPLGPWCAVDPSSCPWFAGEIRRGTANATRERPGAAVAYDYCRVPPREGEAEGGDPVAAAALSLRAAALAEAAREEVARASHLLAEQRRAVMGAAATAAAAVQEDKEGEEAGDGSSAGSGTSSSSSSPPGQSAAAALWAPTTLLLPPSVCRLGQHAPWDQCGGKSACGDWACADAAWPGRCCPAGYVCERQHAWFWQCVPPAAAASFGGDAAEAGAGAAAMGTATATAGEEEFERQCDPVARREREVRESAALAAGAEPPPYPFPMPELLDESAQCGGLADCPDAVRGSDACGDRPWPGLCCPEGSVCRRQRGNPWYWQCLPRRQDGEGVLGAAWPAEGAVPPPPEDAYGALRPRDASAGPGPTMMLFAPLSPLAASGLVLEPESGAAYSPESAGLSPGRGFVVSVRVDGDYDKLMLVSPSAAAAAAVGSGDPMSAAAADGATAAGPPALRAFKSGLVEVVAAAAALPPGAAYRVEVTSVAPGSIVADVALTLAVGEGEGAAASAAYSRLRETVGPAYAASAMPQRFGALVGLTISAAEQQGGELVPLARGGSGGGGGGGRAASRLAGGGGGRRPRSGTPGGDDAFGRPKADGTALSPGAAAGVAAAACVVAGILAAAGFAVQRRGAAGAGGGAVASGADGGSDGRSSKAAGSGGSGAAAAAGQADDQVAAKADGSGGRPLVAWPLRSPLASSSPPAAVAASAAAAVAPAFLLRGTSDGGAAAADVAASYATAVPGPSGRVSRRASKNAAAA